VALCARHRLQRLSAARAFSVRGPRPRLKRVSGLDRKLFDELLAAAPPNLEAVSASISDEPQAESVARARARLPRLAFVRLESTNARFDDSLGEGPLRAVMQAARGLKGLQLSLPRLSLATIDACLALAPQLEVQLLTPWLERISRAPADLRIDPRRRQICLPPRVWLDAQLRTSLAEVGAILGEELSVIEESSAAR
jgi:hypothetical protein